MDEGNDEGNEGLVHSLQTLAELQHVRQVHMDADGNTQSQWHPAPANDYPSGIQTIHRAVFGIGKKRRDTGSCQVGLGVGNVSALSTTDNTPGIAYGQDRVGVEDLMDEKGELVGTLLYVLDGHGKAGELAAAEVAKIFCKQYSGKVKLIQEALANKDEDLIKELVEAMYTFAAAHVEKKLGFNTGHHGGTTCSHALLIEVNGQHFVVTSNMGDSPVLIVDPKNGDVTQTSTNHNWDNEAEYNYYDKRCQKKGLPTGIAVYNRYNCGNGALPGPKGDSAPIPIFKRDDKTGRMKVDPDNLDYITDVMGEWGTVGGTQSECRMVMVDNRGKATKPCTGYGHLNWGSTVLHEVTNEMGETTPKGGAQCSRSFADWNDQRLANTIGDEPTVNVTAVGNDAVVLVMSDGATDVIGYMHRFGKKVCDFYHKVRAQNEDGGTNFVGVDANRLVQQLGIWILECGRSNKAYGLENGCPMWDDVTLAGATLLTHRPDTDGVAVAAAAVTRVARRCHMRKRRMRKQHKAPLSV